MCCFKKSRDSDKFLIFGYSSISLTIAILNEIVDLLMLNSVNILKKFFPLLKLLKILSCWYAIQRYFFFTFNNTLELSNNCCRILRFFNHPYFLLDFLILILFAINYRLVQLFFDFLLGFSSCFHGFITLFQIFASKFTIFEKALE